MKKSRWIALASLIALSGCKLNENVVQFFNQHIGPVFSVKLHFVDGILPQPSASKSIDPEQHMHLNAEFVKELYRVVLDRECSEEEFSKWMNVLDQGGSFEGIYNGLVYNDEYRAKEKGSSAMPDAIRLYAQLMAMLALDQKYDPLKIKMNPPQPEPGQRPEEVLPKGKATDEEKNKLIAEMATKGVNKTSFQLKREVGAEAIKVMEYKKEYKEKLATWFGKFAVWTNERKVDFGIAGRNKGDEYYHYKWALENTEDRIRWEVLNRIHRLFNSIK